MLVPINDKRKRGATRWKESQQLWEGKTQSSCWYIYANFKEAEPKQLSLLAKMALRVYPENENHIPCEQ